MTIIFLSAMMAAARPAPRGDGLSDRCPRPIAMSWPMDTGQRPYEKAKHSFTTEVLEPPENITAVEVNVN